MMKAKRENPMRKSVWITAILFVFVLSASAFALTPGQTYTVKFGVINSSGVLTPAAYSTTAIANANGVINFSLGGLPDATTCNFMGVAVFNATSSTTPEREAIVPCPVANSTMPLGVTDVTNAQAAALMAAFHAAGTDDPILAVFGLTIVQTSDIDAHDLATIATYAEQGIVGNGGFINSMEANHGNIVNGTTLSEYRKNIVQDLADPNSGYTKFLKEAASSISNSTSAQDMGKAAALILSTLVEATKSPTDTGIHAGWIIEGTDAMGNVMTPVLGNMGLWDSPNTPMEAQATVGAGLQKLREQVAIQKYENAMTTLGANGAYVTQFQNAATALSNAVDAAMEQFNESSFANGPINQTVMQNAQQAMQTATTNAFNAFQNAIAASDAEIGNAVSPGSAAPSGSMIDNICTALGNPTMNFNGSNLACNVALPEMDNQFGMFSFFGPNGEKMNWPINMVILANWVSTVLENNGTLSYKRDTTDFDYLETNYPNDMILSNWAGFCNSAAWTQTWATGNNNTDQSTCQNTYHGNWTWGQCSKPQYNDTEADCTGNGGTWQAGDCSFWDKGSCNNANSGMWTPSLSCFGQPGVTSNGLTEPLTGEAPAFTCQNQPYPYWIMFAIQQDIQVVQDIQMNAMQNAQGMGGQATAQQNLNNALGNVANHITGTTDGSTAITKNQQQAIMELMSPPQM